MFTRDEIDNMSKDEVEGAYEAMGKDPTGVSEARMRTFLKAKATPSPAAAAPSPAGGARIVDTPKSKDEKGIDDWVGRQLHKLGDWFQNLD